MCKTVEREGNSIQADGLCEVGDSITRHGAGDGMTPAEKPRQIAMQCLAASVWLRAD